MENQLENQLVTVQETTSNIEGKPEVRFYPITHDQRPNTRQKSSEKFRLFFDNPGLNHIGLEILLNLDVQSLLKFKRVNKTWMKIIDSPKFWVKWGARMNHIDMVMICKLYSKKVWYEEDMKQLMKTMSGVPFDEKFYYCFLKRK